MQIHNYLLQEIKRKLFHLFGLVFPILYYFINKPLIIIILLVIALLVLYIDNIRHTNIQLQTIIENFFNSIMRDQERSGTLNLSGISYFISGLLLSAIFFNKKITIVAWLVLIISDSSAALVGKMIGKPYIGAKSIEGSIAFLVTSIMISITTFGFLEFPATLSAIVITSAIVTWIELNSDRVEINDNLSIPISYGLFFTLLNYLTN